jgi:hypothetical protein
MIKSRKLRWAGHVARMEDRRVAFRVLVKRPKGGLGDNIKINRQKVGWRMD